MIGALTIAFLMGLLVHGISHPECRSDPDDDDDDEDGAA